MNVKHNSHLLWFCLLHSVMFKSAVATPSFLYHFAYQIPSLCVSYKYLLRYVVCPF